MTNPVVHFEILSPDGNALAEFYRGLFGWQLHDGRLPGWPHYALLRAQTGIGGAVGTADALDGAAVVVYVEVDDPDTYVQVRCNSAPPSSCPSRTSPRPRSPSPGSKTPRATRLAW